MNPNYLDFEQPIADLEAKIQELRHASHGPAVNIDAKRVLRILEFPVGFVCQKEKGG